MEQTNFWFPWKFPLSSRSTCDKAKDNEHFFQYQKPVREKKPPYNVVCVVSTQNESEEGWCEMIRYQNQRIYKVGCFVISEKEPLGKMLFFAEEDFASLQSLLDEAQAIYSYNDSQLFGLLRAGPVPVDHLPPQSKATIPNPLIPQKTDPYFQYMNASLPFRIPGSSDTEHITRPNIVLEKDELWPPSLVQTPDIRKPQTDEKDTQEEMDSYSQSERFVGFKKYFHDCDMIYWLLKSYSFQNDLKIEGVEMEDAISSNADQMTFECSLNHPVDLPNPSYSQFHYASMFQDKKYELLEQTMEFEARLLCDLFTHTHVKKQKIKCLCTKFDRKEKKYLQKWTENGISVCNLGVLVGSTKPCSPPPT